MKRLRKLSGEFRQSKGFYNQLCHIKRKNKMKCFLSNYHISVNPTLVDDLLAAGLEVIMPISGDDFGIWFFAPNDEHWGKPGMKPVTHQEFLTMEPMAILIPCMQHIDDFYRLYRERGEVDELVFLTANSNSIDHFPLDGTKFIMSHDLYFHRLSNAPYKIWYFNQPTFHVVPKDEDALRRTYNERKIHLYVNNFYNAGFEPELVAAEKFRELYQEATGVRVAFFGYDNPDGWPQPPRTHELMKDSMFTLCFKRRETWGQMVNESMQLGTPCIFLREFLWSTFIDYLITPDVAIVDDTIGQLIDRIVGLSYEQYETLVREAQWQSMMFCNDHIRVEKLKWLFTKVKQELENA